MINIGKMAGGVKNMAFKAAIATGPLGPLVFNKGSRGTMNSKKPPNKAGFKGGRNTYIQAHGAGYDNPAIHKRDPRFGFKGMPPKAMMPRFNTRFSDTQDYTLP